MEDKWDEEEDDEFSATFLVVVQEVAQTEQLMVHHQIDHQGEQVMVKMVLLFLVWCLLSGGFRGGSLGSMEPLFARLVNNHLSSSPAS